MRQLLLKYMKKDYQFPIVSFVWRAFLFSIKSLLMHPVVVSEVERDDSLLLPILLLHPLLPSSSSSSNTLTFQARIIHTFVAWCWGVKKAAYGIYALNRMISDQLGKRVDNSVCHPHTHAHTHTSTQTHSHTHTHLHTITHTHTRKHTRAYKRLTHTHTTHTHTHTHTSARAQWYATLWFSEILLPSHLPYSACVNLFGCGGGRGRASTNEQLINSMHDLVFCPLLLLSHLLFILGHRKLLLLCLSIVGICHQMPLSVSLPSFVFSYGWALSTEHNLHRRPKRIDKTPFHQLGFDNLKVLYMKWNKGQMATAKDYQNNIELCTLKVQSWALAVFF